MTRPLIIAACCGALLAACDSDLDLGNTPDGGAAGGSAGGAPAGGSGGGSAGGASAGGSAGGAAGGATAGGAAGGATAGGSAGGRAGGSAGGAAGGATAGGSAGGVAGGSTAGGAGGGGTGTAVDNNIYLTDAAALYRFDPNANTISKVGNYNCLSTATGGHDMADLALNSAGELYGTTYKLFPPGQGFGALVKINPATASCTFVVFDPTNGGIFPVDIEFFPAGVVQTGAEVLVGMDNGEYVKVNTTNGDVGTLGNFAGGGQQTTYLPEGGIAAVGGKGYARVYTIGSGRFVAEFKPLGTGPFSGNMVKVLNFNLPNQAVSFVRVGGLIYAFGEVAAGKHQIYAIDPVAETITPLPPTSGGPASIYAATAAPLAP
ncbi:MAG: hypothetical protein IPJ65_13300 [Archangiaceae bacterium]|nr:hypothetical protein [Archangiaceae bacterium]